MAEPVSNINDAGSPVASGADRISVPGETPRPPELPGMSIEDDRYLPEGGRRTGRLNTAAETIGGAVGSAVGSVRRARLRVVGGRGRSQTTDQVRDTAQQAREKMSGLAQEAGETVSEWKDVAADRMDELRENAGIRARELSHTLSENLYTARRRADYYKREYPLQTIMAFGGLAFVVGFVLRMWRSNGD